jgi:hypothetical protein
LQKELKAFYAPSSKAVQVVDVPRFCGAKKHTIPRLLR